MEIGAACKFPSSTTASKARVSGLRGSNSNPHRASSEQQNSLASRTSFAGKTVFTSSAVASTLLMRLAALLPYSGSRKEKGVLFSRFHKAARPLGLKFQGSGMNCTPLHVMLKCSL